jgi:hypothetical protein
VGRGRVTSKLPQQGALLLFALIAVGASCVVHATGSGGGIAPASSSAAPVASSPAPQTTIGTADGDNSYGYNFTDDALAGVGTGAGTLRTSHSVRAPVLRAGNGTEPAKAVELAAAQAQEERDAEIDAFLARLKAGFYAFSVPPEMNIDDEKDVVVKVGYRNDESLRSDLGDAGVQTGATKLARRMSADLSDGDFAISPKTAKVQFVDDDGAEWRWSIKPKSAGDKSLTVTLSVVFDAESGKTFVTETRHVPVKVTAYQKWKSVAQEHWPAVLGAVMAPPPLLVALWALLRKRRTGTLDREDD